MKHLFICLLLLAGLSLAAQTNYDEIRLRNGEIIKCNISEVNLDTYTIFYSNLKTGGESAVSLNEVGSYVWDGEINKGLPKPVLMKKQSVLDEPDIYAGDHNLHEAGVQLTKFADLAQAGIVSSLVGSAFVAASFTIFSEDQLDPDKFKQERKLTSIGGYVLIGAGFIMHAASYSNARKAGEKLKLSRNIALNSNTDGIGLRYSLK